MGKKLTYKEVKDFIEGSEGNGCRLLSTEYVNNRTKLQIQCKCGEVFEASFNNFKDGNQRQCPKCGSKIADNKQQRLTYQEVKDYIESKGCELLSDKYINIKSKLRIKCACGEVFEKSFDKFKHHNQRQCPKCGDKLSHNKQKLTFEEVKYFIEGSEGNGCRLLSTEYVNNRSKLIIRCACGETFETTYTSFVTKNKRQCDKCGVELRSGENSPHYNPNLTDEERENMRRIPNYKEFTEQVFERDDYTCQCCSKKGGRLNAHHLNGYNWCKEHRTDELNGITLCKGCHSELHSIYGYGNNTIEQFREFLYNKYLQTKDLKYLATLEDIDIRKYIMLTNNLSLPI